MASAIEVVVTKHRRKSKKHNKQRQISDEDRRGFTCPTTKTDSAYSSELEMDLNDWIPASPLMTEQHQYSQVEESEENGPVIPAITGDDNELPTRTSASTERNDDEGAPDISEKDKDGDEHMPADSQENDSDDDFVPPIEKVNTQIGYSISGDLLLRCGTCGSLVLEGSLQEHFYLHGELLQCDKCDFTTTSKGDFNQHAVEHEDQDINMEDGKEIAIPCQFSECGLEFKSIKSLWRHCKIKHTLKIRCPDCKKKFRGKEALVCLQQHFSACPGHRIDDRPKKCPHCDASFKVQAGLKSHIIRRHTKRFRFECGLCAVKYVRYSELVRHEKKKKHRKKINQLLEEHPSQKSQIPMARIEDDISDLQRAKCDHYELDPTRGPSIGACEKCGFLCKSCGAIFPSYKSAQQHRHHQSCEKCGKVLFRKRFYKLHIRFHDPLCSLRCDMCEFAFERISSYTRHMKQHDIIKGSTSSQNVSLGEISSGGNENPSSQLSLTFPCSQCQKVFSKNRYLKEHTARVHNDKKFSCDQCSQKLSTESSLRRHIKVKHDEIIAFECDICGKKCFTQYDLNRHKSRHDKSQEIGTEPVEEQESDEIELKIEF